LKKNVSSSVADSTRIIYGGSVTKENASDLAKQGLVSSFPFALFSSPVLLQLTLMVFLWAVPL
jgi:hypothetical protein